MAAINPRTAEWLQELLAKFTNEEQGVAVAGGIFLSKEGTSFTAVSGSPREESETMFSAASISKLVVGTAIMQCVEDQLITLDDDVGTHLPESCGPLFRNPSYPEVAITVEMLLTHTSSLRDSEQALTFTSEFRTNGGSKCPITLVDYFQRRFAEPARSNIWWKGSPPGSHVHYSNAGFTVLGLLIEHVRGKPFAEVVSERIFAKLGMTRSCFFLEDAPATAEVMVPCQGARKEYYEVAEFPAAQLRSTATDLIRFLRTFTKDERPSSPILSVASIERMLRPQRALAWWAPDFHYNSGIGVWEHGGCMQGIRSYCFLWETGTFVVLQNTDSMIERDASKLASQLKDYSS